MIEKICVGLLVCCCSLTDIKKKEISVAVLWIFASVAILLIIFNPSMSLPNYIFGAGVGLIIRIISEYSKESIGKGDAYLISVMGLFLGVLSNLYIVLGATLISMIYSIILLIRKYDKKHEMPFVPFLSISYAGLMLYEKIS